MPDATVAEAERRRILAALKDGGPCTVPGLTRESAFSRYWVAGFLHRLRRQGLVERVWEPGHGAPHIRWRWKEGSA